MAKPTIMKCILYCNRTLMKGGGEREILSQVSCLLFSAHAWTLERASLICHFQPISIKMTKRFVLALGHFKVSWPWTDYLGKSCQIKEHVASDITIMPYDFCISFYSCRCSLVWWENSSFLIFVRLKPANPPILFLSARTNRNTPAFHFATKIRNKLAKARSEPMMIFD